MIQRNIFGLILNVDSDATCDLFSAGVASRKSKVIYTSNRLTQAHWHRPWTALFRWPGLVVCKSTRENSDTVFLVSFRRHQDSKPSLFIFIKCSQLNKIDRKNSFFPLMLFNCTHYLFCCIVENLLHPSQIVGGLHGGKKKRSDLTVNCILFCLALVFLSVRCSNSCF